MLIFGMGVIYVDSCMNFTAKNVTAAIEIKADYFIQIPIFFGVCLVCHTINHGVRLLSIHLKELVWCCLFRAV